MATRLGEMMPRSSSELRIEPTTKRIRAFLGGKPLVDSERALLVWEPRRVVPAYPDYRGGRRHSRASAQRLELWSAVIHTCRSFDLLTVDGFSIREASACPTGPLLRHGRYCLSRASRCAEQLSIRRPLHQKLSSRAPTRTSGSGSMNTYLR